MHDGIAHMELWAPIPEHPGYEASDLGQVRSVDREIVTRAGRTVSLTGRVLSPQRRCSARLPQWVVTLGRGR